MHSGTTYTLLCVMITANICIFRLSGGEGVSIIFRFFTGTAGWSLLRIPLLGTSRVLLPLYVLPLPLPL